MAMDVVLGDPDDLPQVVENLSLKGFCAVDAGVCGELSSRVLTEVQQRFQLGRFVAPPSTETVHISDGLLGREGSARIAQLSVPDSGALEPAERDGAAVVELDEFISELSIGLMEYLPALGTEASTRSVGMFHETTISEPPIAELTESDASSWMGTFSQHRLMVLFFVGPETGTLRLSLFDAAESSQPQEVPTGPNTMVILRPDLIARKHSTGSPDKTYVFSCFINSMREVPLRPGLPVPEHREALAQWIQDRLKELKDMELEDEALIEDLPRQWVRAMNSQFYRGQQACIRSSASKLPGPLGWDPDGFFPTTMAGADFVLEVPHRRFNIDQYWYKDPKEELWTQYKSYSRHGSFIDGEDLFDNKQFSVSAPQARGMPVSERWGLEVGYESLFNAGWQKKKLQRAKGDVMVGVHSTENQFNNKYEDTSGIGQGGSVAKEANLISFTLNIMGQSLTFDTDGSSSMTALWQGHLEQSDDDEFGRKPPFSLVVGTAWNTVPACFANFCFRRLLTTRGRCFAFDQKATGFVRGEGCAGLVLDHLYSVVDGEAVVESNGQGIVRAAEMMQCGRGAVLAAPSATVIHETIAFALRRGGMQPGDIDVVECHAPGAGMMDTAEANSLAKVLRKDADAAPLPLTDTKTNIGDTYAAAGIIGFLKALHCMRNALVGANDLVRQLNPHIDMGSKAVNVLTEPMMVPTETTGFSTTNSFGTSGTYVSCIAWADRMELFAVDPESGARPATCVFWPGGGGELEEEALPENAYYLAGTFNQWVDPLKMEERSPGEWTATVVLGDNRYEQFQIWLDGKEERTIHPGRQTAPRNTHVYGPEDRSSCSLSTWQIDGRPLLSSGGGSITELPNKDRAEPGTNFLVRLRVAGKYRIVDWERQEDPLATPAPSSYYVVGTWNGWEFQEMTSTEPDVWSCEVRLESEVGEFAIVRNKDWTQAFYPADFSHSGSAVYGPDYWGRGLTWAITATMGDVFRIQFRRELSPGKDEREVTWEHLGNEPSQDGRPKSRTPSKRSVLSPEGFTVDSLS
uniref:Type I polyketide synthase n=1 Tax=Gambierdiscus excentricus TaxID=986170 RepID=A0A1S6K851_9DINO|nr:type I polyketide synthase [Gambierdiscus excentricus]